MRTSTSLIRFGDVIMMIISCSPKTSDWKPPSKILTWQHNNAIVILYGTVIYTNHLLASVVDLAMLPEVNNCILSKHWVHVIHEQKKHNVKNFSESKINIQKLLYVHLFIQSRLYQSLQVNINGDISFGQPWNSAVPTAISAASTNYCYHFGLGLILLVEMVMSFIDRQYPIPLEPK